MEICQTFRLRAIFPRSISQNNKPINLYKFSIVIFSRTIYKTYRRDRLKRYKIFHSRNSTRNSIIVTRDPTRLLKNRKKKKKKGIARVGRRYRKRFVAILSAVLYRSDESANSSTTLVPRWNRFAPTFPLEHRILLRNRRIGAY